MNFILCKSYKLNYRDNRQKRPEKSVIVPIMSKKNILRRAGGALIILLTVGVGKYFLCDAL